MVALYLLPFLAPKGSSFLPELAESMLQFLALRLELPLQHPISNDTSRDMVKQTYMMTKK